MSTANVQELRKNGWKIRIAHLRITEGYKGYVSRRDFEDGVPYPDCKSWAGAVSPRGGKTLVTVTSPEGQTVEISAQCNEKDNYNRRRGVQIALGRALKKFGQMNSWKENFK